MMQILRVEVGNNLLAGRVRGGGRHAVTATHEIDEVVCLHLIIHAEVDGGLEQALRLRAVDMKGEKG